MFWLTLVTLMVLAGAGALVASRVSPSRGLPPKAPAPPSVFTLAPGDIVQHLGTDYLVESTITYKEDGLTWQSHLLTGGKAPDDQRWLVVEEDDRVVIALVAEVDDLVFKGEPGKLLKYRGMNFKQREAGRAEAKRRLRSTGRDQETTCRYFDYDGPDQHVLYVEHWPGGFEVTFGRQVSAASLTILPGERGGGPA